MARDYDARRDIGPRSLPTIPTRCSTLSTSIIGMIEAESARRTSHSVPVSAYVWKTSRSDGTRIATRWIAALTAMPSKSVIGRNGFITKIDDVAERRTLAFVLPKNWQGASDARLRVFQVLGQAQLAGDDIEWTGEVRTLVPGQDVVTKVATALALSATDIGADPDGIDDGGGPHVTELVIDHDDPANPLSAGCLVLVTLWRATVGGAGKAGGTVVFRVDLAYAQRPRHERA